MSHNLSIVQRLPHCLDLITNEIPNPASKSIINSTTSQSLADQDAMEEALAINDTEIRSVIPNPLQLRHLAIVLKTGHDVALNRVPIQLLTFLKNVENLLIIGDAPGVRIGSHIMHDVVSDLYEDPLLKQAVTDRIKYESENNITDNVPQSGPNMPDFRQVPKKNKFAAGKVKRSVTGGGGEIVPDTKSDGWRKDAHKNLPAFKKLYEMYPHARWFFMVDDDTFAYLDTLLSYVKRYNWNKPYYMGIPNVFKGCDGVKKFGDGPHFAHGGSGILLSRGAIQKLVEPTHLRTCMARYRRCFAGDVRTALCMRDAGVLITRTAGFHGYAPNAETVWTNPCENPITFHHLLVSSIQALSTVQEIKQSRIGNRKVDGIIERGELVTVSANDTEPLSALTTMADVFRYAVAPTLPDDSHYFQEYVFDLDWPSLHPFRSVRLVEKDGVIVKTVEARMQPKAQRITKRDTTMKFAEFCRNICEHEDDRKCITWVWDGTTCWLKNGMGGKAVSKGIKSGFVSGIFVDRFSCST
ncbi:hypothetical protein HK098_004004 [Nowakowskiella sp. JEL0407]|nr:hypothetical protein HK098_004004 [Nowakowskiella sp. JEL0407]